MIKCYKTKVDYQTFDKDGKPKTTKREALRCELLEKRDKAGKEVDSCKFITGVFLDAKPDALAVFKNRLSYHLERPLSADEEKELAAAVKKELYTAPSKPVAPAPATKPVKKPGK